MSDVDLCLAASAAANDQPGAAKRDAVVFAWFVAEGGDALGEFYLSLLRDHHAGSKLFIGMNHGSSPVWESRLQESGLDATIRWARAKTPDYWDATGFLTALEGFHRNAEDFDLVWFGHTKGGSVAYDEYATVREALTRDFWVRPEVISKAFADPRVGLFAPRYNLTPPYPFPGPWQGWAGELTALQRVYRDQYQPLGLAALDTFFVLRGHVVRRFCTAVGDAFFHSDLGAFGANKWFFEMAFPSIASMQGYEPYITMNVPGENDSRADAMMTGDVKQVQRLAREELARWREDPTGFQPRIIPWDRAPWVQRPNDSAAEAEPPPPRPLHHRLETRGWVSAPGAATLAANPYVSGHAVRVILTEPAFGAFRIRLALTARGMEVLHLKLRSQIGENVLRTRSVWVDVSRPGALHHELERAALYTNPGLSFFKLELEGALEPGEALAELSFAPASAEQNEVPVSIGMSIGIQRVQIEQITSVREVTRFVPERIPERPRDAKRKGGPRDVVVFAWFVPDRMPELGDYYLGLLRYHHPDSKLFIGMNRGSDPAWEARFQASGLDADVRWARPNIGDFWDTTGFLTALEGFHESDETFDLAWFGHTKGGSGARHTDYHRQRIELQRNFWTRTHEIELIFADPTFGLFARRFTPRWEGICGNELSALLRVYREAFAPIGIGALDAFFVLRGEIVRRFCDAVGDEFFRVAPGEYGANRWWFEMAFPSIAAMQGYWPWVDMTVDGANSPRDDVWLRHDPKQNHRIVLHEVDRWRADPTRFTPRRLRESPDP